MAKKSLGSNFFYSALKTLMGTLFPLITFRYIAPILGANGLGKIDYAQSNITYFTLIAAFGISGYAIREGARIRDDKDKISEFAGEILGVNLFTVAVAYILCFLFMLLPKLEGYRGLMLLFSSTILLSAMGLEWLYNIYEDYKYITIRSFVFQVISMILMFTLVKKKEDYIIYAFILILSSVGSNVLNLVRSRKYIKLKVVYNKNFFKHIKTMFFIFIMYVSSSIYLVMDRSMLGYITGNDDEVGLYGTAIKIHVIIFSLINTVRVILTPRASYYMGVDKKKAEQVNYMAVKLACMLAVPSSVGIFCLSGLVLNLFTGNPEFIAASLTLRILMLDVVFATINGVLINQIFIVNRKDKWASAAVAVGAFTNLILNACTIPRFGKEGAAVSTFASELAIFIFACIIGRSIFNLKKVIRQIVESFIASVPILILYYVLGHSGVHELVVVFTTVILGATSYFVILLAIKNEYVLQGYSMLKDKFLKKSTK